MTTRSRPGRGQSFEAEAEAKILATLASRTQHHCIDLDLVMINE